jgi:hypothetical protein
MTEKEVAELGATLGKCEESEVERIVDVLKLLQKQEVSYAILKSTKVGKTVGSSKCVVFGLSVCCIGILIELVHS